ncbi:hypothetical protein RI129_012934 [Pyrocoelia pectoralis]|uniref:CRAL-TRIO domain-containing protein n=1 Tax=Pyrocoelia pectoralis TaxID=417401 RepID=A0AAN7V7A2_9COLE
MPMNFANVGLEYMKRKELKEEHVQYLQVWLQKQPHIPEMQELEIIFFLHSCKYNMEVTKATIDNYYTLRALSPELFGKRDPVSMKDVLRNYVIAPLPTLANDGSQIILSKLKTANPDHYALEDYVKYIDMVLQVTMYEKGTFNGLIIVFDATGYTLSHLTKVTIPSMRKFFVYLQEAIPVQLTELHIFNFGTVMEKFKLLAKPFLKKELLDLLHTHGHSISEFYKTLPKEDLPKEYGGSGESLISLHEQTLKKVVSNMDFIEELEKKISDESKRLQKSSRVNDLFGMEGSFKKLDID